jgi:hypothetical protein
VHGRTLGDSFRGIKKFLEKISGLNPNGLRVADLAFRPRTIDLEGLETLFIL